MTAYLFTSERLGFRNWTMDDFGQFAQLNADPDVMRHFPKPLTNAESENFFKKLLEHFNTHGYNYFAVEILETVEWIGFIGLAYQEYAADFTPATDIGWRLKKSAWGNGFATEGAKKCLEYAFNHLKIDRIIATCTLQNHNSENVMHKIGMTKMGEFNHPRLADYPDIQRCVWYEIEKESV
ncbi:MAG: GNAT family N-acetyltransferase [Bacteroidia bacterium]